MHQRAGVRAAPEQSTPLAHIVAQNNDLLRSLAADALNSSLVETFAQAAVAETARIQDLLTARRQMGKVRRCHGDLHLRNLCIFDGKPTPFDAIEFDEHLATIDVLYDLAFLLMDLWGRGLREAANRVFNRYLERTEDFAGLAALPLFLATRAAIRVHVTLTAAMQQEQSRRQELRDAAAGYFALARSLLERSHPQLVVIGGLSGTGKSVQSRRLAPALAPAPGAVVLRSDVTRKRMMGVEPTTRLQADSYRPAVTAQVYAQLARDARAALAAGHSVLIDAVCARAEEREVFRALAESGGARFAGVWLEAPLSVRVDRIGTRQGDASDATDDVAARQEGIDVGDMRWRRVPAGGPPETTAAAVRAAVEG
jgi:predicted kinase